MARIKRFMQALVWLPQYQRSWLKQDVIAGLSVWTIMVPTSLGYATLAGIPVQKGLYAAAAGMIAFALFTTSKQLVQGPGSATAPVLGAAVVAYAAAGSANAVEMATAVTLVAGVIFMVMAVLRTRISLRGHRKYLRASSALSEYSSTGGIQADRGRARVQLVAS